MTNTTKPASEIKVGDLLCERDGYMMEVKAIERTGDRITFTVDSAWGVGMFNGMRQTVRANRLVNFVSESA